MSMFDEGVSKHKESTFGRYFANLTLTSHIHKFSIYRREIFGGASTKVFSPLSCHIRPSKHHTALIMKYRSAVVNRSYSTKRVANLRKFAVYNYYRYIYLSTLHECENHKFITIS